MRIALIGMSGTGKSYWSRRLARIGFETFSCDDHIGHRLVRQVGLVDASIEAVGHWMGFPYEAGFAERESHYLELERRMLSNFLAEMETQTNRTDAPCVIDTTGSVIYLDGDLLNRLRRAAVVVYLAAPQDKRRALLESYRTCPRPVVWQGRFRQNPGENTSDALARSYMELIDDRDQRYHRLAHLTIELPVPSPDSPDLLLGPVRAYLEEQSRAATP